MPRYSHTMHALQGSCKLKVSRSVAAITQILATVVIEENQFTVFWFYRVYHNHNNGNDDWDLTS